MPEIKVVWRGAPFHKTLELELKFVPLTVSVNPRPPATAPAGFKDEIVGTFSNGGMTVNPKSADLTVVPPEAGVETSMLAVLELTISAAAMKACNRVLETIVVGRALPFHKTLDIKKKLTPSTVKVKADPPAVMVPGVNEVITGATGGDGWVIVKAKFVEMATVPPEPGLETATFTEPALTASAAVIAACN